MALQSDGKIVAAGGGGANSDFALARFEGGGRAAPPTGVDLSVAKSGPTTVSIGDRPTYTVRVTNNSTTTSATNVSLSDTLSGVAVSVVRRPPAREPASPPPPARTAPWAPSPPEPPPR